MADCSAYLLAAKVGLFLEEGKNKLQSAVKGDVEFIKTQLELFSAMLSFLEPLEDQIGNAKVRRLMDESVELAFDIEDILDEFKSRFITPQGFEKKITRFIKGLKQQSFASKILSIVSRITRLSAELQRCYTEVTGERPDCGSVPRRLWLERRDLVSQEDGDLVGICDSKRQLIEWLTNEDRSFEVISVVGMAGVGKTSLVRKVYQEATALNHFGVHAFISLLQLFDLDELLKGIIHQVVSFYQQTKLEGIETMGINGLKDVVKMSLQERRFLIVIDNVWNLDAWYAIKDALPFTNHGSRVLLTTRNRKLACTLSSEPEGVVYTMEHLSNDMSWQLFCARTFPNKTCPQHLMLSARRIFVKYKGLPLAIIALADVLSTIVERSADEWEQLSQKLGSEILGNALQDVAKSFLLSYHDLPFRMKACFLYACAISENIIRCSELFGLWIAEGFVVEEEGQTKEQVARDYLNELVDRSLIQESKFDLDGAMEECCIHSLVREVILSSKSRFQGFTVISSMYGYGELSGKTRRLRGAISMKMPNYHSLVKLMPGLQALIIMPDSVLPKKCFPNGNVNQLKVLVWGHFFDFGIIPNYITNMSNLKYLSLNGGNIWFVPSSIGNLRSLEILDLGNTRVINLPSSIKNLQRLRCLVAFRSEAYDPPTTRGLVSIPDLGCLHSLQVLWYVELNQNYGDTNVIEELGRLHQLKKLRITNLKREDNSAICYLIEKLTSLRRLEIVYEDSEKVADLRAITSPPQFLEWLELQGRLEKVPNWMSSLYNLVLLKLMWSRAVENVVGAIQALPSLVHLELVEAFDGNKLVFADGGFHKLTVLCLEKLHDLRDVTVEKGSMIRLEKLIIQDCPYLEKVPSGVENLSRLKLLLLENVSEDLMNRIDRTKGGEDCWRIEHVAEVRQNRERTNVRYPRRLTFNL